MFIGCLTVNIYIPGSRSLKDRRRVVKSIQEKARLRFNVSAAEKLSDTWQSCELSFACVNYTKDFATKTVAAVEEFIRSNYDIQIVDSYREVV